MPRNPLTDPEWAPDLADQIERVVGTVRTLATDRVVVVVRAVVFSIIIGIAALVAVTLLIILSTRLLQTIFEGVTDSDSAVWISYLVMAAVLAVAGVLLMRARKPKDLPL
jgi:H+/Cl- antiporter ClcA